MADVDRIIARLRRNPPEVDFRDLRQVLEAHGWRMASQSGSHVGFRKPGRLPMSIPLVSGRRVKRAYIRQVLKAIEQES
jgi:predicted RNA binding protein YcfA (HicA-like mRNA interferase family)